MTNLLLETLKVLEEHGKSLDDVLWVGSRDGTEMIPLSVFKSDANRMYDAGYGSNKVSLYLVIVGTDWWLERAEYDGSEWWEYKTLPMLMPNTKIVKMSRFFEED